MMTPLLMEEVFLFGSGKIDMHFFKLNPSNSILKGG
jgi:hypothetical protein